ncbi:GP88 family protein [Roseibium alexandrii]|uniref:Gene product 88 domain-containing protein n=1 Tax=Roseibium alexandrii (strain DSM 17067 / NCIMB 14079 / DFL-11) TaxID=244592 RepID=A0A5E8H2N3_ROSAD|nr:hypothetical protein [Roseibium alexandrii]EEE46099.1 hypothetical protein SADFL11_3388 [Roseibium alexandrii DFL-11]
MKHLTKTELAVMAGRPLFMNKVKSVSDGMGKTERVIKKSTNTKLGKKVTKGHWAGMPIMTVTLEERTTCPRSCKHWADCYGNNMRNAVRYTYDQHLVEQMERDLEHYQAKHPDGFVVRLHVLGDFPDVAYVAQWAKWLGKFPALRVYGYTAHQIGTSIGDAIQSVRLCADGRFQIRISAGTDATNSALSEHDEQAPDLLESKQAFICPEQTGKTDTCGTCGLCWTSTKAVVFLTH